MTDGTDETEIPLEALRRRDPAAFALLVERHQPVVLGLCQAMGLRGPERDDAAAEVFANVFRALPRFEGRSSLNTWVYRIACRTIPKLRARYHRSAGEPLTMDPADTREPTPLANSENAEVAERLWEAVARLEEREAMAVELHYRRGWGLEQIASAMQAPLGTIKTLLFRARGRLREVLAGQEVGR